MADSKKPSIPSWQLAANQRINPQSDDGKTHEQSSPASDKETLLEQASRFLQDDSIRDAPADRKIAFLESKGLKEDDIQKLLDVSRAPKATENNKEEPAPSSEKSALESPPSSSPSSTPQHTPVPARDVPPIITYPEFLTQASKPPPLVDLQTVLYTIYGAVGLASTIYGANEFLLKPMLASLTIARHELAETAQQNLEELNKKLEKTVSSIPPAAANPRKPVSSEEKEDADLDSITSDPTELFHRDIATQTTPELEHPSSTLSTAPTPTQPPNAPSDTEKTLSTQISRLKSLSSHLHDILYTETQTDLSSNHAKERLSDLQTYLDSLTYSSPSYLSSSLYGAYGDDSKAWKSSGISSGEADAIAAFRAEVRSAKGVLLSARHFPTGVRGGARGFTRGARTS
ncbi:hypothetical protein PRK78_002673 [Emydomyces testavorans]|uniref:Peroxisomal membrane protein PEX14 n=1 Tax=Emydomyces testavorans TaxID=2070801 RepID=A0AAF0DET3_9EURO|nr:hypothetical protein PRK78_002673 [Emydomyces testavorans]